MAGTADDNSTRDDDWLLLHDVRALVVQRCKSIPETERLIFAYARSRHFTKVRFDGDYIDPRHWGTQSPKIGLYILVDFDNSTVTSIRKDPGSVAPAFNLEARLELVKRGDADAIPLLEDDELAQVLAKELKKFLGPPLQQMHLVRLSRREVLAMLDKAGLPTPSEQSAPAAERSSPAPQPPSQQPAPALGSAPPKQEPHKIAKRTWKPGEESEWLADAQVRYPRQPGESATKYSRRLFPLMEKDFRGRGGPRWAKWEVLRRRLYVWQRKKIKEKK